MDADDDRSITPSEFAAFLHSYKLEHPSEGGERMLLEGRPSAKSEAQSTVQTDPSDPIDVLFKAIGSDGDGVITRAELAKALQRREAPKVYDKVYDKVRPIYAVFSGCRTKSPHIGRWLPFTLSGAPPATARATATN